HLPHLPHPPHPTHSTCAGPRASALSPSSVKPVGLFHALEEPLSILQSVCRHQRLRIRAAGGEILKVLFLPIGLGGVHPLSVSVQQTEHAAVARLDKKRVRPPRQT